MACGSSEGTIYLFNWDGFGAASDRFALRAESIDCMVPITDSIVCVGSLDGVIRSGPSVGRVWDEISPGQSQAEAVMDQDPHSSPHPQGSEHLAQPRAGLRGAAPRGAH